METNYTRRDAITVGALPLVGAALSGGANAEAQPSAKAGAGDLKPTADTAVKTCKAKCMCGQLSVTYTGPDPERRSMCQCNNCQMRTGSVFSVQARMPRALTKIEGKSSAWAFPNPKMKPVIFPSCDSGGATYHFCPECGCTVYWDLHFAPDFLGVAIGALTDPTFPPPVVSGFEAYGHPWATNAAAVPMAHAECGEIGKPCPPDKA